MMTDERFAQLSTFYEGLGGLELGRLEAFEAVMGPVPGILRRLWLAHGVGDLVCPDCTLSGYDLDDIEVFTEDSYEDLPGLVPFASDGGSYDFCWVQRRVDEPGLIVGSIVLVSRGDLTFEGAIVCGRDDIDFFERLLLGQDPFEHKTLGTHWSLAHLELAAMPAGVRPEQVEVRGLHYRTLSPRELVPKERLEIAGVACKPGRRVLLDPAGRPTALTPADDIEILGIPCRGGFEVVLGANGVQRFVPSTDIELDGIVWAAGGQISRPDAFLATRSGVLAKPQILDGIPLAADALRMDANLRVLAGTTSDPAEIDGIAVPAGTRFERMVSASGARLFSARAAEDWSCLGVEVPAGTRFYPHEHR